MFNIEKNIPVPIGRLKYPWSDLQVGESFFVRDGKVGTILSSAKNYSKKHEGVRLIVRKVDGGVRVWRVE